MEDCFPQVTACASDGNCGAGTLLEHLVHPVVWGPTLAGPKKHL